MEKILSIKDERIIYARELSTLKGRQKHKACLLEGSEQIFWALKFKCPIKYVFVDSNMIDDALIEKLKNLNISILIVSDGILKKITDTNYVVPFVGIASTEFLFNKPKGEFVLVLDNLQDHGNIGSIIRTASAFDIHEVIMTNSNFVDPFFNKIINSSRGLVFNTNFDQFNNSLEACSELKNKGYQIVATSPHGSALQSMIKLKEKPIALIVGNETEGSKKEVLDQADLVIKISMSRHVESLNVSVAAGISLYEIKLKVIIAMLLNKIKGNLGRNLSVCLQLIKAVLDKELKKISEISSEQLILLMILIFDKKMNINQVTHDIGKAGEDLDNLLQPLFDQGCIIFNIYEQSIILLPYGEELIAKLWPIVLSSEEKILGGFNDREREQLNSLLSRIQNNCENALKDD